MTQEALKLALEALEASIAITMPKIALRNEAILALREALAQPPVAKPHDRDALDKAERDYYERLCLLLAQPQQEPKQDEIFCGVDYEDGLLSVSVLWKRTDDAVDLIHSEQIELPPPAATQHERTWVNATTWRGLTDEEALECWPGLAMYADCAKFWENIEAKLKAKNEATQN